MRQIVLDNPPSGATSSVLARMRAESEKRLKSNRKNKKRKSGTKKPKSLKRKAKPVMAKKGKKKGKKRSKGAKRTKAQRKAHAAYLKRKRAGKSSSPKRRRKGKRKGSKGSRRRKSSGRIIVIGRRISTRKGNILNMNPLRSIKSLVSKENLMVAGGVVAASIVTRFVANQLTKQGIALPLAKQYPTAANAVYNLAIPAVGAMLTRRFSPALARGMIFGGLAASISSLINSFSPATRTAATGRYMREYLSPVRGTGAYLAPRMSNVPAGAMGAYTGFNAWA